MPPGDPTIAASPEFRLLVESCRSSFAGPADGALRGLCRDVDWPLFVRLARFHRVQGLAWSGLRSAGPQVPRDIANVLAADARAIAAVNLAFALEARDLCSSFEKKGLPILFVKGLTLAALAYPEPFLKMGWDIDILTKAGDLARAAAALEERGYARTIPAPGADLRQWHSKRKESLWSRPADAMQVELHTRLADSPMLIPGIGIDSSERRVELLPGISLPTLSEDELIAYLCVHGASSLWFRLKWVTDLAALLHHLQPAEVERVYERSQQLGAGRASAQAFLHADDLFGSLKATRLRETLEEDRVSRNLAAWALRQVGRGPSEPTQAPLGTLAIHASQFFLLPGTRFKIDELFRQASNCLR